MGKPESAEKFAARSLRSLAMIRSMFLFQVLCSLFSFSLFFLLFFSFPPFFLFFSLFPSFSLFFLNQGYQRWLLGCYITTGGIWLCQPMWRQYTSPLSLFELLYPQTAQILVSNVLDYQELLSNYDKNTIKTFDNLLLGRAPGETL